VFQSARTHQREEQAARSDAARGPCARAYGCWTPTAPQWLDAGAAARRGRARTWTQHHHTRDCPDTLATVERHGDRGHVLCQSPATYAHAARFAPAAKRGEETLAQGTSHAGDRGPTALKAAPRNRRRVPGRLLARTRAGAETCEQIARFTAETLLTRPVSGGRTPPHTHT